MAQKEEKRWVNPRGLEERYSVKENTQAKWRMKNSKIKIPFSKIGKFIFYEVSEIEKWLKDHAIRLSNDD